MKKILFSIAIMGVVGALGIGATSAIFSDEEASTGNTFTTGAIDLKIDNESYYNGELNQGTTWLDLRDLDDGQGPAEGEYLFFDFGDVKPGDYGEDTISLHVLDNDSWLCVDVTLRSDDDNGITEPEGDDGDDTDGPGNGELADAIDFIWWADDGDNVYEVGETLLPAGPLGNLAVDETATVALADSQTNIWGGDGPLAGDSVRYIGKAWCLGDLVPTPVAPGDNDPLVNPGFTCDGAPVDNVTQTDSMTADIVFYAEQSRHNDQFVCGGAPEETTITIVKEVDNTAGGSAVVEDFDLFVDDTQVQSGDPLAVTPGTYGISENNLEGYVPSYSGACDGIPEVTVAEFENAVCTITNTFSPDPQLTIDKSVSFSGPSIDVATHDFDFIVTNNDTNATTTFTDEVPQNLPAGNYTISETYTGIENIVFDPTYVGECTEIGSTDTASITIDPSGNHLCQVFNSISEGPQ